MFVYILLLLAWMCVIWKSFQIIPKNNHILTHFDTDKDHTCKDEICPTPCTWG